LFQKSFLGGADIPVCLLVQTRDGAQHLTLVRLMHVEPERNGRHVSAVTDLRRHPSNPPRWGIWQYGYQQVKLVAETLFALILVLLAAPLMLLSALLVRLTSAGPGFYSQVRIGRNKKLYTIHKIRTMTHNCEHHSGACWSVPGDPRITVMGRFLRHTHLDELPQLWNVLRGQMALVGPRPERPEFVPQLEEAIPLYGDRLLIRPGMTGLAQVQLPPDTDFASVERKLAYDLYYLHHVGVWLDLRILLCTGFYVLGGPLRGLSRFFLPSKEKVVRFYRDLRDQVKPAAETIKEGSKESAAVAPAYGKPHSANGHAGNNGSGLGAGKPVQVFERA
jgi:lipopolysaccharide/colanic/teichoic acid biosynthesis glycosyltransferase